MNYVYILSNSFFINHNPYKIIRYNNNIMNHIKGCYKNDGTLCELDKCDYVQIELLGPHAKEKNAIALVSKSCLDTVLQFQWYLGKDNYPITHGTDDKQIVFGKGLKLHKLLYPNVPKGSIVDHMNHDRLDNRIDNLRICTQKQNSYNTKKRDPDKYKGIYKQTNGLFTAKATKDGKVYQIKDIAIDKEAAKIYDMIAEELFGEYAGKNFN